MAVYFDQNGNLIDTEINESSNVFMEDPTENFYPPIVDISATQDYYPQINLSATQDYYPPRVDISATQDFYPPRQFVNVPQDFYPPNLISTKGLPTLDLQSLPANMGVANEEDVEQVDSLTGEKKSGGITDLLGFFIPGFNFLKNRDGTSYERFTPGSTVKDGIYSLGTFNQPVGMVNDFYDPITNTNRFDRATARYKATGSVKDLFASSRTGKEFFKKLRERKAAKEAAKQASAKLTQDIQDRADRGESLSDIGKAMFTGPGMAFEARNTGTGRGPK